MSKLVFIDTETNGLNIDLCEVWEIGAIARTPDGDIEYCWQIRPELATAEPGGLRIGRYYQRIADRLKHKEANVGDAWIVQHPDPKIRESDNGQLRLASGWSIAAELAILLDGAFLVGAVPWFDERFLQKFLRTYGQCAANNYHLIDVETLAAGAAKLAPPWDFDAILAKHNLAYDEADRHTALGDARMARDLYDAIMAPADAASIDRTVTA